MSEQMNDTQEVELRGIDPELLRSFEAAQAKKAAIENRANRFAVIGEQAQERIQSLESTSQTRFNAPIAELPALVARLVPETEQNMRDFIESVNQAEHDLNDLDQQYQSLKNGD